MGNAFIYRMPAGIAGDVTRREHATIEGQVFDTSYPILRFGEPVKMVSGKVRPWASGDVVGTSPTILYGFGVRPYPTTSANASDPIATAVPNTTDIFNVMRRGYMTVKVQKGTPVKNATVWVRNTAASDPVAQPIGGLECAAADGGGTCVEMTNVFFMGTADANGLVEISFKI